MTDNYGCTNPQEASGILGAIAASSLSEGYVDATGPLWTRSNAIFEALCKKADVCEVMALVHEYGRECARLGHTQEEE